MADKQTSGVSVAPQAAASRPDVFIGSHRLGPGTPAFVIAEVAQAHDGSLGAAHAFIDAAADSGADAVKFQTHIATAESTLDEPFRVKFSQQDTTRYDYWRRMEFTPEQWAGLAEHAGKRRLTFLSSPFSLAAVELLEKLGVPAWKVGSGEFRSENLIGAMMATGKPILFSTGMANWDEIGAVATFLSGKAVPFVLFQCTSQYPTPLENVGLNVLHEMRQRFHCPVGLSDHSGSPFPGLAAMAQGADLLEVHVTFDRRMFGPDTVASVTFDQLRTLTEARDAFYRMQASPVDKNALCGQLEGVRQLFTKSLAPSRPLPRGTVLQSDMLVTKKPGTGIAAEKISSIIGKTLACDVTPDRLLTWNDIE